MTPTFENQPDNQEEDLAFEQMAERTREYEARIGLDEPQDDGVSLSLEEELALEELADRTWVTE